jgi:maltose O-acetyltransferase
MDWIFWRAHRSWTPITVRISKAVKEYLPSLQHSVHVKLRLANTVSGLLPDFFSGIIRARLYRLAGFEIGPSTFIMGNLEVVGNLPGFYDKLIIGSDCSIGNHVTISLDAPVHLGTKVSLGPYVLIYTGTHQIGPGSQRRMGKVISRPVTIEDGCWIGLSAVILPGVTVGRGSIVAAGTVVAEDVPPNSYVEGNPARIVRQLPWGNR